MDLQFLKRIRLCEAAQVLSHLKPGSRILELGAGAGWQAEFFSNHGHSVEALDIPGSIYSSEQVFPVQHYDGVSIPCETASFDVIFSSNVLEHVEKQTELLSETKRVLIPGGQALHIVPSASWRFWTSVAHYPGVLKELVTKIQTKSSSPDIPVGSEGVPPSRTCVEKLRRLAFPSRHGERGNHFSELSLFSKDSWISLLDSNGFTELECSPLKIFYSGYNVLGAGLPIATRIGLSKILGASTFLLKGIKRK